MESLGNKKGRRACGLRGCRFVRNTDVVHIGSVHPIQAKDFRFALKSSSHHASGLEKSSRYAPLLTILGRKRARARAKVPAHGQTTPCKAAAENSRRMMVTANHEFFLNTRSGQTQEPISRSRRTAHCPGNLSKFPWHLYQSSFTRK